MHKNFYRYFCVSWYIFWKVHSYRQGMNIFVIFSTKVLKQQFAYVFFVERGINLSL